MIPSVTQSIKHQRRVWVPKEKKQKIKNKIKNKIGVYTFDNLKCDRLYRASKAGAGP